MRIIFTCLILLVSGFSFSQFSRTFLHANWTNANAAFTNYSYYDAQNKVNLVSVQGSAAGETNIVTQKISGLGDVESLDRQTYAVTLPTNTLHSLLLTVIEQGNTRYIVLGVGGASTIKLVWLKVNATTGALISTTTSVNDYKTGYFEPKLVGSELVTYMMKTGVGITRVALDINTFTAPTEESVSSVISSASFNNTITAGAKTGHLFVVGGREMMVWDAGSTSSKLYTRTAPGVYTDVNTGVIGSRSISAFLMDATTIGITNGMQIEHYNASGTMIHSGNFSWSGNSNVSQVEFFQNQYHIYYKITAVNKGLFVKTDQAFQVVDSVSTKVMVYHMKKSPSRMLLVGSALEKGLAIDLEDNPVTGRLAYCEAYTQLPRLKYDEYRTELKTGKVEASIGLGTRVISGADGLPGTYYEGISAAYNLSEHFVGFLGNDTISNDQSIYTQQYDELPGPHTTSGMYDEIQEAKYNRAYRVSRQMIQEHIQAVQSNTPNYTPRWEIRNWPAHGNPALGQAADLAPFADINSNGIYEPLLGEYPVIFGDDCVFSITHYRTDDDSKALEFHSYVYLQRCDTSEVFDNLLMRKLQIYSRGSAIDSLMLGGRFDGDLGNYIDDYTGTNVDLGMVYNYNADLFDEDFSGRKGFGDTLAAQGVMVLKGFKLPDDGLDNEIGILPGQSVNGYGFNDGVIDNEYYGLEVGNMYSGNGGMFNMSDPSTSAEWYNMLNGYFRFGDTIFYGGTGFQSGTLPTHYMYSGNEDTYHAGTGGVDPGFGWYEFDPLGSGSQPNLPGDRRCGFSFGKTAIGSGEFVEVDYIYLIKRQSAPAASLFEPVTELFAKASAIRTAFLTNDGPCGINFEPTPVDLSVEENSISGNQFTLYPNPTTGLIRIKGISETGGTVQIFDINGKILQTITGYQPAQELDLSELEGSLFILQITSESKTEQKRVVKY
ncbi:hypothetical protein D3C87_40870 [compost metagenome]